MTGKFVLSVIVACPLFFAGCAGPNAAGKPAGATAPAEVAASAQKTSEAADPKSQAKKSYYLGMTAMMHNDWKKAEGHFRDALKLNPDNLNTHMLLARVYEDQHKMTDAIVEYEAAVKLKPEDPGPYEGLMGVYLDMGLADKAISTAAEAGRKGVPETSFTGNLGWAYYIKDDFGDAEKYFKKDKELKALDSTPRNNLGLVYFRQGRYEDALASFNEASDLNKKSVLLPYFLALTYDRLGREDEALKALKEGVKRDPDLEAKIPGYKDGFFFKSDPGDLSALFKKLKEEKD